MYNRDLTEILMEHGQYAELIFRLNGRKIRLQDLEGRVIDDEETVTLNFVE